MNTTSLSGSDILAQVHARAAKAADLLNTVKYIPVSDVLSVLKADAEKANAAYPQYKNYWDGYKLGRVTKAVKTKMGLAFEKDDFAMFSPADDFPGSVNVYSHRNGCTTVIRANLIKAVP